jgi:hypothetical protein
MNTCGICGRELGTVLIEDHHLIPKTFKGKVTVPFHKICHQKLHTTILKNAFVNIAKCKRLSSGWQTKIRRFISKAKTRRNAMGNGVAKWASDLYSKAIEESNWVTIFIALLILLLHIQILA